MTAGGRWRRFWQLNPRWVVLVFALLFAAGSTTFFSRRRGDGSPSVQIGADGRYYWAFLTSMVLDRDLDFENQYANPRSGNYYRFGKTHTGHYANVASIGPAILWMPAFAVARAVSLAVEPPSQTFDGNSYLTQVITLYSSLLMAFAAMLIAYRAARAMYGPGPACAGAVIAVVCGPVLHYAIHQPHYAHAASALSVTALLYVWMMGRRERRARGWMALGALLGLAMLVRAQNFVFVLPMLAEGAMVIVAGARSGGPRGAARAALGPLAAIPIALLVFSPQMIAWRVLYGSWVADVSGSWYIRLDDSVWSATLFSSRNGLFPYAPFWLFGLLGLIAVVRSHRWLGLGLIAVLAGTTYLNGAFWHFWGMGSFGGRRFDGLVLPVALGFAALVRWAVELTVRRPRLVAGGVVGAVCAFAVTCSAGMSVDFQNRISGAQPEFTRSLDYYDRIGMMIGKQLWRWGNPLSWPAALAFSLRTGAPARLYDEVVGPTLIDGYILKFLRPQPDPHLEVGFAQGTYARFLVRGFGPPRDRVERPLYAPEARMLVPLLVTTDLSLRLVGRASADGTLRVLWNGAEAARATLAAGAPLDLPFTIPVARVRRDPNLLDLEVDGVAPGVEAAVLRSLVIDSKRIRAD